MADGARLETARNLRPIVACDLFCGAGGSSTGAARAVRALGRRLKLMVVNHWQTAIDTHSRNHPDVEHFCADLEHIMPRDVVPGGKLDLLIASPTCTFHSRARGGRPVHDQQRMDPWHVVRWCTDLRVERLMVENVPEFIDWGPCSLQTGRPVASRKGEYFRAWCDALRAVGFRLDWRVINCADFGDATTRQRFFLIGRADRKRLAWPEPSHARNGSTDLVSTRKRWRAAAEIIDWTIPGKSIFSRKRPLAENTLRRILSGAERYGWPEPHKAALRALLAGTEPVLDVSAEDVQPFLLNLRGTEPAHLRASAHDFDLPLGTLTAGGTHVGLVMATGAGGVARALSEPIPTVTAGGDGGARPHFLVPLLMGTNGYAAAKPVSEPAPTITTGGAGNVERPGCARPQLMEALIAPYYGSGSGETCKPASAPLDAVTTKGRFALVEPVVLSTSNSSAAGVPRPASEPLRTITTAKGGDMAVASPFLVPNLGEREGQAPRTHGVDEPLPTVTASGHIQLAEPAADGYRIDILYRMLHWRELARAMSFDDGDEVYEFAGNATEITKQIGNAVPARTAQALVRALVEE